MSPSNSHLTHPKYRPDIDGLRAVAVLSVVIFHAFPTAIKGGFIGVDIFFVISGFLISTIIFENLDRGTFSFGEFYMRRVRRIFPGLVVVLAACYAFGWFALVADEFKELGKHMAGGALFISNLLLWQEAGYFDKSAETKPLLHLWSLGIEEQFYIVWPLLLWLAWKRKFNLLTLTILVGLISFALNMSAVRDDATAAFYSPQRRFWELLCGSLLAWLVLYRSEAFGRWKLKLDRWLSAAVYQDGRPADGRTLAAALSLLGVIFLLYGFIRIRPESHFPGTWALLPVLGAVLVIAAGPKAWLNRHLLSNRVVVWFGLISFPLYLWHWPLLSFARIMEGDTPSLQIRATAAVAAVGLAWLTMQIVEKPLRHGGQGILKASALVSLMVIVGGVGAYTSMNRGLENRFPPETRELAQFIDFKWAQHVRMDQCHLQDRRLTRHAEACQESGRPLVALWGDSHAASLYPGFKKLQEKHAFGLTQLTQAGCPPVFGMEKLIWFTECNAMNARVFDDLVKARPDVLVVHAAWVHEDYPMTLEALAAKFSATARDIKSKMPAARVVVVGPVPRWNDSPQKTAFLAWRKSLDKSQGVSLMLPATSLGAVEDVLSGIARENGFEYLSPTHELCEGANCRSRVGDGPEDFIAVDPAHFSRSGAEFFVAQAASKILGF